MTKHINEANALRVQKHMQEQSQKKMTELELGVEGLQSSIDDNLDTLDDMMLQMKRMLSGESDVVFSGVENGVIEENRSLKIVRKEIQPLDFVKVEDSEDWDDYLTQVEEYASRHSMDLKEDPFKHLLTDSQRADIERRFDEDFTVKNAQCDKYDYMLAAACGSLAGLIDIVFVGVPKEGALTAKADKAINKCVERFAGFLGWNGPNGASDPTKSAIGFLEKKFPVNYDQTSTNSTDPKRGTSGQVKNLSASNHHVRSVGHSPDIIGLFFSIYNQLTSTTSFFDEGKIITIDSQTFELQGSNFISKIFAGFCNWLGHLFSDMAGSSSAISRGSGIPMPFYSLLQLIDVGEFGQHKQSFSTVAVKIFEQGYDFRHGLAMAVPVLISEVMTRLCWTVKRRYYHGDDWSQCMPNGSIPEVRRMLLISHGALCLIDGMDAGLRSGGEIVLFMLRANLIAWVRFSHVGLKEVGALWNSGKLDIDKMNAHLDQEYERLLSGS